MDSPPKPIEAPRQSHSSIPSYSDRLRIQSVVEKRPTTPTSRSTNGLAQADQKTSATSQHFCHKSTPSEVLINVNNTSKVEIREEYDSQNRKIINIIVDEKKSEIHVTKETVVAAPSPTLPEKAALQEPKKLPRFSKVSTKDGKEPKDPKEPKRPPFVKSYQSIEEYQRKIEEKLAKLKRN